MHAMRIRSRHTDVIKESNFNFIAQCASANACMNLDLQYKCLSTQQKLCQYKCVWSVEATSGRWIQTHHHHVLNLELSKRNTVWILLSLHQECAIFGKRSIMAYVTGRLLRSGALLHRHLHSQPLRCHLSTSGLLRGGFMRTNWQGIISRNFHSNTVNRSQPRKGATCQCTS